MRNAFQWGILGAALFCMAASPTERRAALQPPAGVLDLVPSQAIIGAWSDRKLSKNWNGPLWQLSRASDGAVLTVWPSSDGLPSISEVASFCGASTLYLTRRYDQSGAGNDFTQTAGTSAPVVCASGVLNMINNHPTGLYNGSSAFMSSALAGAAFGVNVYINLVFNSIGTQTTYAGGFMCRSPGYASIAAGIDFTSPNLSYIWNGEYGFAGPTYSSNINYVSSLLVNSSSGSLFLDGSVSTDVTAHTILPGYPAPCKDGTDVFANKFFSGYLPERFVLIGTSAANRSAIENNQRLFWRTP